MPSRETIICLYIPSTPFSKALSLSSSGILTIALSKLSTTGNSFSRTSFAPISYIFFDSFSFLCLAFSNSARSLLYLSSFSCARVLAFSSSSIIALLPRLLPFGTGFGLAASTASSLSDGTSSVSLTFMSVPSLTSSVLTAETVSSVISEAFGFSCGTLLLAILIYLFTFLKYFV